MVAAVAETATDRGPTADGGGPFGRLPGGRSGGGVQATVTLFKGHTAPFNVVGTDPADDIAVIRVQNLSGLTPITIGSSKDLKVGQHVVAVGSPLGLRARDIGHHLRAQPPGGHRRRADRSPFGDERDPDRRGDQPRQLRRCAGRHGRRRGWRELRDRFHGWRSRLAGRTGRSDRTRFRDTRWIRPSASPTNWLRPEPSSGPRSASSSAPTRDGHGATVAAVAPGSAAAAAGLPKGALITKVDDRVIDGPEALAAAINSKAPGDTVAADL